MPEDKKETKGISPIVVDKHLLKRLDRLNKRWRNVKTGKITGGKK